VVFMPRGLADLARNGRSVGWGYFLKNIRDNRL
jgi:hypothetical protein